MERKISLVYWQQNRPGTSGYNSSKEGAGIEGGEETSRSRELDLHACHFGLVIFIQAFPSIWSSFTWAGKAIHVFYTLYSIHILRNSFAAAGQSKQHQGYIKSRTTLILEALVLRLFYTLRAFPSSPHL